ncbi:copper-translocating P-type ATPase [Rhodobacteraceae bacterium]|nr:copper-translocating P-type ATPase [Paracoccaceae bacterium]
MHCGACTGRVEAALRPITGVKTVSANLMARSAQVDFAPPADTADLTQALEQAGYPASTATLHLEIDAMTCASCAGRIERALYAHPAVIRASVNFATSGADVTYAQGAISPTELIGLVKAAGYSATATTTQEAPATLSHKQQAEAHNLKRDMWIAAALTVPVFVLAMGAHMIPALHRLIATTIGMSASWWIQMVLSAIVLAVPGRVFFRLGLPALFRGQPEMNSLVALGALASFGYSAIVTIVPDLVPASARGVYFEAAAMIVTLILLGRWLEARAKGRAGEAISRLVGLRPDTARVERGDSVIDLPVADLATGDIVQLPPGGRVAVDGIVTDGHGWIDESMLSGEPAPVEKTDGSPITGGTVNGQSPLTYRVTATGGDTVLSRIITMVEQAQGSKLPVQAMVDRVTRVFVPVVIALSVLTFGIWMLADAGLTAALVAAISVMIIACPCAMGLATPVSILVGTGRAAQAGLLFRRGDALQRLAESKTVAFDKTGTLTQGHPDLTDLLEAGGPISAEEALRLAAGAEGRSEHPLATAIIRGAQARGLAPAQAKRVKTQTGLGLTAQADGHAIVIGNLRAMTQAGIATAAMEPAARALAEDGKTPVWIAVDGQLAALAAVSDPVKPEARPAIAALQDRGIKVVLISGDTEATAQAVGKQLGISHVIAGVMPDGKVRAIEDLKAQGTLAFVGDGINDAPALAAADVGLAIGTGTDVAIEAADVVLMQGDPQGVARAITLSRKVMRNIHENLFWAFAYNAALIPVAMGVLVPFGGPGLSPLLAAAAMAFSSTFVVSNALRLRRVKL